MYMRRTTDGIDPEHPMPESLDLPHSQVHIRMQSIRVFRL